MLQRFLLLLFITVGVSANAQKRSNRDVYAKTITAADLKRHLTVIAGPEMEGRDTPSPGLEKAADYIAAQFSKAGVKAGNKGGYRQTFELSKDSVAETGLEINGTSFNPYVDFAPYFTQVDDMEMSFDGYAFVGYGIADETRNDYKDVDVKGKLVVFFDGRPKNYVSAQQGRLSPAFISNKIKTATDKGAKAIIVVMEKLPSRMVRCESYTPVMGKQRQAQNALPIFVITPKVVSQVAGAEYGDVVRALDNGETPLGLHEGKVSMKFKANQGKAFASNIIGVVEGSDKKDEYVIITAHYDHVGKDEKGNIFYGADDDGSGTVSVIGMAAAFAKAKKAGNGPRRTVVFMTVSGEEKGLWGSEYYAANPIFPLEKTTVNLNIDMIGRIGTDYQNDKNAENYVYVVGDDKLSTDLTPITESVNSKYLKMKLDRKFNDPADPERIYYRSDHYNFARNGVPAIFYFNGLHPDYHQITDTIDKINFELMAKRAQLVFHTAWEMANRNHMLKRDLKLPEAGR